MHCHGIPVYGRDVSRIFSNKINIVNNFRDVLEQVCYHM